jgi:hypothetical protein
MLTMLSGYKTYLIGTAIVAYGVALLWQGQNEQGMSRIMEGLGLIFLRQGVAKVIP